ncbi:MAG: PDZ domain-containing protein, partial [Planctomycetes bacterium]|nr:PDZ domain-containing protein [Planctomycetota bacterium]
GAIRAGEHKIFNSAIVSDTPLSPGSSGGGLYDMSGRLVAVNAAVTRNERGAFSVPIEEFLRDAQRLKAGEHFDRRAGRRRDDDDAAAQSRARREYFDTNLADIRASLAPRTIEVEIGGDDRCAGLIVDAAGLVLTAAAPFAKLAPGTAFKCRLGTGRALEAHLIAIDRTNEVALLRLPNSEWPYDAFTLSATNTARRGQLALALENRRQIRGGIVGAPRRTPPLVMTREVYYPEVVQVDLRLDERDLGAPIVDRQGDLIGMVVQHRLRQPVGEQRQEPFGAFLLPGPVLAESLAILRTGEGRPERPVGFLGVRLEDLTEIEKSRLGIDSGVRVALAAPRFPAHQAGIRARDVIVSIKGHRVGSRGQAVAAIANCQRGEEIPIVVRRNARVLTYQVRIVDRSDI